MFWKKGGKREKSGKDSRQQGAPPSQKASSGPVQQAEEQCSNTDAPAVPDPKPEHQLSQQIWNQAYDEIEGDQKDLIESYMRAVTIYLQDEESNDTESTETIDVSTQLNDQSKREEYLREVVRKGKIRIQKTVKVSRVVGGIADTILAAKPVVDLVTTIPHAAPAAIPWAGACICLQVSDRSLGSVVIAADKSDSGKPKEIDKCQPLRHCRRYF